MDQLEPLYSLIKRFEGCRLKAYLCPAEVWTVGWGSTGTDIGPETVWTQEQADARMKLDAAKFANAAKLACPNLQGPSLCAIADFAYNCGISALMGSTLRKKINEGKLDEARAQLMRWTRGGGRVLPGLVKRRSAEVELLNF